MYEATRNCERQNLSEMTCVVYSGIWCLQAEYELIQDSDLSGVNNPAA
jgi:hypothetical protein